MPSARYAAVGLVVLWLSGVALGQGRGDPERLALGLDLGLASVSGHLAWTDGNAGKLRRFNGDLPVRAFAQLRQPLGDTLSLVAAAEFGNDGTSRETGLTQLFLRWRPVPRSRVRHRLTVGAFYPRISLEHSQVGWSSKYSLNPSAIGAWVGEELRTFGAEWQLSTRVSALGGEGVVSLAPSVFVNNDPTGALIAWRGWSIHDRQSTLFDRLPLAPLPLTQPGERFDRQAPYHAPFREVDGRPGVSLAADYKRGASLWRAGYFDNRAQPEAIERGQYGWRTRLHHVGVRQRLLGKFELLAQWLRGSTRMGSRIDGQRRAVDAKFASQYIQLSRVTAQQTLTARIERFRVVDRDALMEDDNNERGHGLTLAYRWSFTPHTHLAAEWLRIRTERPGWAFTGLARQRNESQLQLRVQLRY